MVKIFRGAAPLLLAASAFGLARPAEAQAPALFPQTPATADAAASDGVPPLPRVVPPKRPTPTAPGTISPTAPSAPVKAGVDLLTPPAVPSAWSATPIKGTVVPTAASKTPAPPPERKPAASYPSSMTPAPRSAYAQAPPLPLAAPATHPPVMLKPMVASAAPVVRPTPPPKRVWPSAFQTRDEAKPYETTGVVYFDKSSQSVKQAAAIKPAPVAAPGDLRGRIATLCGADAVTVVTAKQPNGGTLVKVRVHDAGAEQKVTSKILQIPEMAEPRVHLLVEVKP